LHPDRDGPCVERRFSANLKTRRARRTLLSHFVHSRSADEGG
jgi:hypothetical protein